jgi:hypothetical protein
VADVNWNALFDEAYPEPGVPPTYLADNIIEQVVFGPLSEAELKEVRGRHGPDDPDPATWSFPTRPFPPSYRSFLAWSNGGTFVTGEREFQMLMAQELREYLLLYDVPGLMPGAVPFGLNGAGGFYLFDMRNQPDGQGEYPILFAATDHLIYDDAVALGHSLPDVFRDGTNPEAARP